MLHQPAFKDAFTASSSTVAFVQSLSQPPSSKWAYSSLLRVSPSISHTHCCLRKPFLRLPLLRWSGRYSPNAATPGRSSSSIQEGFTRASFVGSCSYPPDPLPSLILFYKASKSHQCFHATVFNPVPAFIFSSAAKTRPLSSITRIQAAIQEGRSQFFKWRAMYPGILSYKRYFVCAIALRLIVAAQATACGKGQLYYLTVFIFIIPWLLPKQYLFTGNVLLILKWYCRLIYTAPRCP